jgi:hypothetical protein
MAIPKQLPPISILPAPYEGTILPAPDFQLPDPDSSVQTAGLEIQLPSPDSSVQTAGLEIQLPPPDSMLQMVPAAKVNLGSLGSEFAEKTRDAFKELTQATAKSSEGIWAKATGPLLNKAEHVAVLSALNALTEGTSSTYDNVFDAGNGRFSVGEGAHRIGIEFKADGGALKAELFYPHSGSKTIEFPSNPTPQQIRQGLTAALSDSKTQALEAGVNALTRATTAHENIVANDDGSFTLQTGGEGAYKYELDNGVLMRTTIGPDGSHKEAVDMPAPGTADQIRQAILGDFPWGQNVLAMESGLAYLAANSGATVNASADGTYTLGGGEENTFYSLEAKPGEGRETNYELHISTPTGTKEIPLGSNPSKGQIEHAVIHGKLPVGAA